MTTTRLPPVTLEEFERARQAFYEKCGGAEGLQRLLDQHQAREAQKRLAVSVGKKQKAARLKAFKLGRSQCKAKTRTGARCTRPALPDGTQCSQHRGVVRWVNKKAIRTLSGVRATGRRQVGNAS